MAKGNAVQGLIDIVKEAKCGLEGIGLAIEKGFQGGRENIERLGVKVYSCAIIKAFKDNKPVF